MIETYQLSERGCGTYAKAFLSNASQPEESPLPFDVTKFVLLDVLTVIESI